MKVISVVNYKGGVGKTTCIANIATKLAIEGNKVLMIDLDPQGSLTFSFIKPEEWADKYKDNKTIKNWFDKCLNNETTNLKDYISTDLLINKKSYTKEPLNIIPSHLDLFDVSLEMAMKLSGLNEREIVKNKMDTIFMLSKYLKNLEETYDYVFIDCNPSFDLLTQNAVIASDYYLIPTKGDYLSTLGIDSLLIHIEKLIKEINRNTKRFSLEGYKTNTKLLGVVSNMVTIGKGNDPIMFLSNRLSTFRVASKYKMFKKSIRNNPEFMDMGDLLPAIVKKADNETKKRIIYEIENIVEEFKDRVK